MPVLSQPGAHTRLTVNALGYATGAGLGGATFKKIMARFADPAAAFRASAAELAEIEGLHRDLIESIVNFAEWVEIEREIQRARAAGITMIPFSDTAYPVGLRTIADPPPLIYVKGEIRDGDEKAIAIVGSRSASNYGRNRWRFSSRQWRWLSRHRREFLR